MPGVKPIPHVVIIGGGFGGLAAAKRLSLRNDVKITLVDRHNYHLFQPLLYQVAMAGLSPGEIATPIRTIFARRKNVRCLLGEITDLDIKSKVVYFDNDRLTYDYLVIACGAQHGYFGHEEWEPFAPGLKSLEQATEVRRRVLSAFEAAEREKDPERIRRLLTFVIVGGGPTGVELAGSLCEISRYSLSRDFRSIDPSSTRILLLEAGPRVLSSFTPELSERARMDLEKLGATVRTNTKVINISSEGVQIEGEQIKAATVLWAAGVVPSSLNARLGLGDDHFDKLGRVFAQPDLSLTGYREVFVIGDQANFSHTVDGKPLPGLAPVAMQEGRHAANNIAADLDNLARVPFYYVDKGQMATIGRRKAVAQLGKFKLNGALAWLVWLFVHIIYLIGFRNRLIVLIEWAWSYFTYRRGAQLIIGKDWRSYRV